MPFANENFNPTGTKFEFKFVFFSDGLSPEFKGTQNKRCGLYCYIFPYSYVDIFLIFNFMPFYLLGLLLKNLLSQIIASYFNYLKCLFVADNCMTTGFRLYRMGI